MEIRSFPYTHCKFTDNQNALFKLCVDDCTELPVDD